MNRPGPAHYLFVTGRLAEPALRKVVARLAQQHDFRFSIAVMPITVAALMTPQWLQRHLRVGAEVSEVILPGYVLGDLQPLQRMAQVPVVRGPRDLYELPQRWNEAAESREGYGEYRIEILAEINHAPDLMQSELIGQARQLCQDGADVIDLGCNPGQTWQAIGQAVRALRAEGMRVSVDSFNSVEVAQAVDAGVELVLSVNQSNVAEAVDWNVPLVVIPDRPGSLDGLDQTIDRLQAVGRSFRIDPILEPIGCGFTESLFRYREVRRRYPETEMLMGIGNLTELTDVDSAGLNVVLIAICAELQIHSVLTTQVIPWAQSCVRECDVARRIAHYAVTYQTVPKRLDERLVMLRDPRLRSRDRHDLTELAGMLKDNNYRIFAENGQLQIVAANLLLEDTDPYQLFQRLLDAGATNVDITHAFYLGYELAKATTALTLGKQYRQDEALDWGMLTVAEPNIHSRRRLARQGRSPSGDSGQSEQ